MVRLIMGTKGSGKTKKLIELIDNAAKDEPGHVICIEANSSLAHDIHYQIRLIEASEYKLNSYEVYRGFISGLYAGNYDITHMFIDNLCKVARSNDERGIGQFLNWLDAFTSPLNLKATITVSADPETATDTMRKYM